MKKTLDELWHEAHLEESNYAEQRAYIEKLMAQNKIKPVKAAGSNGKKPPLYTCYQVIAKTKDLSPYLEELKYQIDPKISISYYAKHLKSYQKYRSYVLKLSEFFHTRSSCLTTQVSLNERSFQIWQNEKFLNSSSGKAILNRCQLDLSALNVYSTAEPLPYYVVTRNTPQTLLILENKDPYYTMHKLFLTEANTILGEPIGTLIYGSGKGISKILNDFAVNAEPYMQDSRNTFIYFGDLDYEGIIIFETLASSCPYLKLQPFKAAYLAMLDKAKNSSLPTTKEKQNRNISNLFWSFFEPEVVLQM
ncbi:MAG: hypothetical protein IJU40_06620, partial [Desulfovibrionaceae bacterium]|nr:hypothetical protein [Desulfovibrionaceae bacterium]